MSPSIPFHASALLLPAVATAGILLSSGCGEGGTSAKTPTEGVTVPNGTEFTLNEATIRVPDRMVAIDFAKFDEAVAAELERRIGGDQGRQLGRQVRAIASRGLLDFCAFDPSTPGDGFAENVNVIIAPLSPGDDRASVLAANLAQFAEVGVSVLATDEFTSGDLVFDRFRTSWDQGAATEGQAYLLVHDGKVHTITFSASPLSAGAFLAGSEDIMRQYRPR